MKAADLIDRWNERDRRYALELDRRRFGLTPELADGVRQHRAWEITQFLTRTADRAKAFRVLGDWAPPTRFDQ